jgi:hypothetical protein
MTRRLLVIGAVIAALVGVATVASADEDPGGFQSAHVLFLGDCEGSTPAVEASTGFLPECFGFGIFFGLWNAESMAAAIAEEAYWELGGEWDVVKLKAFNLAHGGAPIMSAGGTPGGEDYGLCELENVEAAQSIPAGELWGVWIAFFVIEPCEIYTD